MEKPNERNKMNPNIIAKVNTKANKIKNKEHYARLNAESALILLEQAQNALKIAIDAYKSCAKSTGRWNYPIANLDYYSKNLGDIISSDGGEAGLRSLLK